tara:strand:- start:746 stop:1375 length:630 start_codon:yes stop_codon:yes gene_type:complete
MRRFIFTLFLVLVASGCQELRYKTDKFSLNSANAKSYEYPITINNHMCLDLNKRPGLCALQHQHSIPVKIEVDPRPYSYLFFIKCTKGIFSKRIDVPKGKPVFLEIAPDTFEAYDGFSCIGEVFPDDRENVSARFNFLVRLVKADYLFREEIALFKDSQEFLVLGRHSLYSTINGKTKKKKTIIKNKPGIKVYTESYAMRFNQYGYEKD